MRVNHIGFPTAKRETRRAAQPIDGPPGKDSPFRVEIKRQTVESKSPPGMPTGIGLRHRIIRRGATAYEDPTIYVQASQRSMEPHARDARTSVVGNCDVQNAQRR
jgi:hypothetical protein